MFITNIFIIDLFDKCINTKIFNVSISFSNINKYEVYKFDKKYIYKN